MAQEGLAGPWVAWEAVEETEVASPPGDLGAPGETPQEEGMSSTELGTGSVPIRKYTRGWGRPSEAPASSSVASLLGVPPWPPAPPVLTGAAPLFMQGLWKPELRLEDRM